MNTNDILNNAQKDYFDESMAIIPEYSKKQVRKAGEVLIGKSDLLSEDEALNILSNWRSSHTYPLNSIQNSLRYKAKQLGDNYVVTQRLKRKISITNKLHRFPNMKLDTMQDIGGCRAILPNNELVYTLSENMKDARSINIIKENDYISKPKETGYRGIHLISKYCGKNPEFEGLQIEIQIRSEIQHYWATAVEIIDRFTKQQLKAGLENNQWNTFFKVMSLLMSQFENHEQIDIDNAKTIAEIDKELKVREKLHQYSVITKYIGESIKEYNLLNLKGTFLLILNADQKEVEIEYYSKDRIIEATNKYLTIEKQENVNTDVVLVSAASIKELEKGYPNYFADSAAFLKHLEYFIENKK